MVDVPGDLKSSLADRYRIEREIGAGGMATVYLARDVRHGRTVAVKVLRSDVAAAMGVERFQHEVTLTAALQHPHILSLFDSGQAAGCLYYVAPYVGGESLREKLEREGQLRIDQALEITRQVADALDHAHRHGIVHRDIKPGNILLAAFGGDGRSHALVADFGIARALPHAGSSEGLATADSHRLTQTGITLGTPMYMSPEQAMGDSRVDARSDIYSLGCVAYEMLAGEPPFNRASAESLAARKLSASISSIALIRSSVPASVDSIIRRALLPVAADRYATAGEFAAALSAAFATPRDSPSSERGRVTGAPTAGVSRLFSRPGIATLATVGLALIGVAGWVWSTRVPHTLARVRATVPRDSQAYSLDRQAHIEIDRRTETSIGRAVGLLQRAIVRDSEYADAWADLTRALVFAYNNRYDVPGIPNAQLASYAVRAGDRALEADSTSAIAWIARATSLYLIDPSTEHGVIPALHRAIALDSSSADAWYLLGSYYEDALEPDSALLAFRRATAIRPTHPGALAFLALHFMWQHQSDSAMVWADSAARSNPTNVLSRQARGLVLIQRGRVLDAAEEFTATVRVGQGPERVWGWTGLAVVASRRHDRSAVDSLSVRAIADADTLHPSHHEAVYLAWMYAETGQRERALAVLERFAEPRHLHFQLHLRREFTLDSLRREARFAALLRNDLTPRQQ
jgi:serine/threonine protein kinase